MNKEKLESLALEEGYYNLRWLKLNNREVLCGLSKFVFTFGLVIDIDEHGYSYRYCFPNALESIIVINQITEVPENPIKMMGNWIKCKGLNCDIVNPNFI